jgi:hypothetical protein
MKRGKTWVLGFSSLQLLFFLLSYDDTFVSQRPAAMRGFRHLNGVGFSLSSA